MPAHHYMLPAGRRLPGARDHIARMGYFVLHAPRQSGKTTALLALARELVAEGSHVSALVSMEVGAPFHDNIEGLELPVLDDWRQSLAAQLPPELLPPPWPDAPAGRRVGAALSAWASSSSRPLAVFLDEVDALRDDALVAVLRQLRAGFPSRPGGFPASLALVGLRDVRDYVVASGGSGRLGTASPFNIKVESITLRDFTRDEIGELYAQHTGDTGQGFLPEAVDRAWHYSRGQPWLVNALAAQAVDVLVKDRAVAIRAADIDAAKDILVRRQDTHLDSLAERLREPRVRQVIEPMLAGAGLGNLPPDDLRFVADLGLVRASPSGGIEIANPVYAEVIPGVLQATPRASLPQIAPAWLDPGGKLVIERLLESFLAFWRRHGEALQASAPYREVAPQLVMMAFLDRVANGGGSVEREYAIGRGRIDLCLRWGEQHFAFELKTWRDRDPDPLPDGLEQLDAYLAGLGLGEGWLVIFDQRSGLPPIRERTRAEAATLPSGRGATIVWG